MKQLIFFHFIIFILGFNVKTFANEITVVDTRRNIPLSDEETVYKDYYLNAGETAGLKRNLVVNVKRKIAVKDNAAKSIGEFETTVGQIKIIFLNDKIAIGREYKLISRDEEPMIEQIGIMSGDRIDLAGAFTDSSKLQYKKKIVEVTIEENAVQSASSDELPVNRQPAQSEKNSNSDTSEKDKRTEKTTKP